jgi:hypothetical protein
MNDIKAVRFLQELLFKTKQGKIHWQQTANDQSYVAALGGKFGLAISCGAYVLPVSGLVLTVDEGGRELVRIAPEASEAGAVTLILRDLYETAMRQAVAVDDDKLDTVLEELHRL